MDELYNLYEKLNNEDLTQEEIEEIQRKIVYLQDQEDFNDEEW